MLKRAAEESHTPPVPLKRRSIEVDASLRAEWQSAEQQLQQRQAISSSTMSSSAHHQPSTAAPVDASFLTAEDWSCAHELNALFSANAQHFPSIRVRSRTTYTRAETAAVAARIVSSSSAATTAAAAGGQQRAKQHLALAAHVLSMAFAPFPTAALSLYEIEAPSWLAGWASKWCSSSAVAAVAAAAPTTPRNSPAASSASLSSCDSDDDTTSCGNVVVIKLMALHGYAEGQPACGQGAGLGEEPTGSGGRPARTVFLPIW